MFQAVGPPSMAVKRPRQVLTSEVRWQLDLDPGAVGWSLQTNTNSPTDLDHQARPLVQVG